MKILKTKYSVVVIILPAYLRCNNHLERQRPVRAYPHYQNGTEGRDKWWCSPMNLKTRQLPAWPDMLILPSDLSQTEKGANRFLKTGDPDLDDGYYNALPSGACPRTIRNKGIVYLVTGTRRHS